MIVGVDHLGWSVASLDRAATTLSALGYREEFRDLGVPNDDSKRPYLREYEPRHDLALYRSDDGSPALELVRHGDRVQARGDDALPTVLLDAGPGPGTTVARPAIAAAVRGAWDAVGDVAVGTLDGAPALRAPLGRRARVAAYVVAVAHLARALRFWTEALGFRRERAADSWALLRFAAPVPAWRLDVLLILDAPPGRRTRYLDEAGITNIALLSTDIEADRRRIARSAGAEVASIFDIEVNGRPLRACVGRTPDGDVIEVLHVRTARTPVT